METGHNKNVANFETATLILNALGAGYDPSQPLILPAALQTNLTAARAALAALRAAEAEKKIALNARAAEFEDLEKLAVNVRRAAEVNVNDAAFTADLQSIIRKFQGGRADERVPDDPATPDVDESAEGRSVSQRSYDNLAAHFADLIALLKTRADYEPNEPEFQIPALEAKLAALQAKNAVARTANANYGSALDARDEILYNRETGILKLVKLIKTQLALNPGKDSSAYRQINALEFRKFE